MFGDIGVTNFNTDHLRAARKPRAPIVSNQVSFSLLDRRAAGALSASAPRTASGCSPMARLQAASSPNDGSADPSHPTSRIGANRSTSASSMSLAAGPSCRPCFGASAAIARKHGVSIANVATRWVMQQPAVAAVIVGARLGESEHRTDNLRLFAFGSTTPTWHGSRRRSLSTARAGRLRRRVPEAAISHGIRRSQPSPREPPKVYEATPVPGRPAACTIDTAASGSRSPAIAAPCASATASWSAARRQRMAPARSICPGDVGAQTTYILDKIVGQRPGARRQGRRHRAHAGLPQGRGRMGAGGPCPRPLLRRCPPGQHHAGHPRADRRLLGRDRGGSPGRLSVPMEKKKKRSFAHAQRAPLWSLGS